MIISYWILCWKQSGQVSFKQSGHRSDPSVHLLFFPILLCHTHSILEGNKNSIRGWWMLGLFCVGATHLGTSTSITWGHSGPLVCFFFRRCLEKPKPCSSSALTSHSTIVTEVGCHQILEVSPHHQAINRLCSGHQVCVPWFNSDTVYLED